MLRIATPEGDMASKSPRFSAKRLAIAAVTMCRFMLQLFLSLDRTLASEGMMLRRHSKANIGTLKIRRGFGGIIRNLKIAWLIISAPETGCASLSLGTALSRSINLGSCQGAYHLSCA